MPACLGPQARPLLVAVLEEPAAPPFLRCAAAAALGRTGEGATAVLEPWLDHPASCVREGAARGLAGLGTADAVRRAAALAAGEDAACRRGALHALERMRSPATWPALAGLAVDGRRAPETRAAACRALGAAAARPRADDLVRLVNDAHAPTAVRVAAAESLGRLRLAPTLTGLRDASNAEDLAVARAASTAARRVAEAATTR